MYFKFSFWKHLICWATTSILISLSPDHRFEDPLYICRTKRTLEEKKSLETLSGFPKITQSVDGKTETRA